MQIAKVLGPLVATQKHRKLDSAKLLIVQPLTPDDKPQGTPVLNLTRPDRVTRDDQRGQLDLLKQLNGEHLRQHGGDGELAARIQSFELAFRMQSEATARSTSATSRRLRARSTGWTRTFPATSGPSA